MPIAFKMRRHRKRLGAIEKGVGFCAVRRVAAVGLVFSALAGYGARLGGYPVGKFHEVGGVLGVVLAAIAMTLGAL